VEQGVDGSAMTYQVRLSQFEGPLDLLLHLIRRDKINIYDIPISHITHEYLAYIDVMKELKLELAGEFFVMAATLMRIKAQMLLPRRSDEEEEEDPRDELVRNLVEYRKFKEAAHLLGEREQDRRKVFARPGARPSEETVEPPTMEVSLFDLIGAFRSIMDDLKKTVSYRIARDQFTVEEKIGIIRASIRERSEVLFSELFAGQYNKSEVITTFLALLELVKLGELIARQTKPGGAIWLYAPRKDAETQLEKGIHGTSGE
jgi:segregation and condensation protein A